MKTILLTTISTTIFLHVISCDHTSRIACTIIGRTSISSLITPKCTALSLIKDKKNNITPRITTRIATLASLPGKIDKHSIPIQKETCTACNKVWYVVQDLDFPTSYEIFTTLISDGKETRQNQSNDPKDINAIDQAIFIQMIAKRTAPCN